MPFGNLLRSWVRTTRRSKSKKERMVLPRLHRPYLEQLELRLPPGDLSGQMGISPINPLVDSHLQSAFPIASSANDSVIQLAAGTAGSHETSELEGSKTFDHLPGTISSSSYGDASSTTLGERDQGIDQADETGTWTLIDFSLQDPFRDSELFSNVLEGPFGEDEEISSELSIQENDRGLATSLVVDSSTTGGAASASARSGNVGSTQGAVPPPPTLPPPPSSPGGSGGSVSGLSVNLTAPEVTNQIHPEVTLTLSAPAGLLDEVALDSAFVDVDVNHNQQFDTEELGSTWFRVTGQENSTITFPLTQELADGTYQLRVRVTDTAGGETISPTVTMRVDLYAGFVGSDALRRLYGDYVLAATGQVDPVWGGLHWGGDGFQHPEFMAKANYFPQIRTSLSQEQFLTEFHHNFVHDAQDRVLINVRTMMAGQLPQARSSLEALGMGVVNVAPSQNLITGYLPIAQIPQVQGVPGYSSMTPVYPPIRKVGSVTSEGDALIRADTFRAAQGITGAGVDVGVISDSVNQVGGGIAASRATGDITGTVQVLMDGTPADSDEGRAMIEIVQDVAPGANFLFHTAVGGPQVFANGILALAGAGAQVIVDDIGYPNLPIFNDGIVSQAADRVASGGVTYIAADSNDGDDAYRANWREIPNATLMQPVQNFNGAGDFQQNFTLLPGETITLAFQWDNAYLEGGSPLPNFQVPTDLDILVTNTAFTMLFGASLDFNDITDEAFEFLVFTNTGAFGTNNFSITLTRFSGPPPTMVQWIAFTSVDADPMAEYQGAPTIFGTSAARNVIAVGAVDQATPTIPEPNTALGGALPFFFDAAGNRLSVPEMRNKPEIVAPDGVVTSFFPMAAPGNRFFGVSAAAPHVAGVVALFVEQSICPPPAVVVQHLMATALDVGAPGFDPLTGAGLIQVTPLLGTFLCPPLGSGILPLDRFEVNEVSDEARDLGTVTDLQQLMDLSIANHSDGLPDYDWYTLTAGNAGALVATVLTNGFGGDLEFWLFSLVDNVLVPLARDSTPGVHTRTVVAPVIAGQLVFVEVKGRNTALSEWGQAAYTLALQIV